MNALPARLVAAIRFLTIFPIPGKLGHGQADLAGSLPYFPIVGLALGCIAAGMAWLAWYLFPPAVAAVLLTVVLLGCSGALHLDGLADTADGFFSSRSREQKLLIMRDSHIGAMGVIALIMVLLLKVSALAGLSRIEAVRAAILAPVAGRCAIVALMALLPYARPEGGLAALFYTRRSRLTGITSFLFFVILSSLIMGLSCWVSILFFGVTVSGFFLLCKRAIGGATGDTLGAVCELSEASVIMAFAVLAWSNR